MSSSGSDVEGEQSDFATRLNWVRGWQSAFFSLYCGVMAVSLFLYLCLLRVVARDVAQIPLHVQCGAIRFVSLIGEIRAVEPSTLYNVDILIFCPQRSFQKKFFKQSARTKTG